MEIRSGREKNIAWVKHILGLAQSIAKRREITKKEELWTEGIFQIMTWEKHKMWQWEILKCVME